MKYWWVNHKQTSKQEISGGFLWSPVTKANGVRNVFYDNMRRASPGDLVVSYASGRIAYLGTVLDFAVPAAKPETFGGAGEAWSDDGWLLPVAWKELPVPVYPKHVLGQLRPLLPEKYSPISADTGNGNQVAYLAEVSREVIELLTGEAAEAAPGPEVQAESADVVTAIEDEVERHIQSDVELADTVKKQVVLARRGQGDFRRNVLARGSVCRLTGLANPALLVASHIKPWRVCASASERLSGANGLMLAPHVDRLFDKGLISFQDDGKVLRSSLLDSADLEKLGLVNACNRGTSPFDEEQAAFLRYHRDHVYLSGE